MSASVAQASSIPSPGSVAPTFALHDTPYSQVTLEDFRGRAVVIVFYIADWHPVAGEQLALYQKFVSQFEQLNAVVLGISVDTTWSHAAFARANGIEFPLLADDGPPGAVARDYGIYVPETGRSRRAVFIVDEVGLVRWSATFPDALNPGVDGIISALEAISAA
jgi:peroxiredoxin